jgi:hypothetical protein
MDIFLDLTKAFDVLNHKLLLPKLELHALRGKIHSWMNSYLSGKTQFVEIQQLDEKTSNIKAYTLSCKEIKYGAPQGPVLLFINDLPPKPFKKLRWWCSRMIQIYYSMRKNLYLQKGKL